MSWLPQMPTAPECPDNDHEAAGAELAPGVRVERRAVLWLPLAAAAAALLGSTRRLRANPTGAVPTGGPLSWEEFLKLSVPVAREMVRDTSPEGQDAYLLRIAAMAVRLRAAPKSRLYPFGGLRPAVEFGPSYRGVPFFVIQWRMEPRAVLPAHCHPRASVCTVGLEGEARVRNFEVEGEAPAFDSGSRKPFLVHETNSQVIRPRRVNTLSATRDNIHRFEAGADGARGIDITTMYGGSGNFSFLAFEADRPRDPARRLFEAAWIGQKP